MLSIATSALAADHAALFGAWKLKHGKTYECPIVEAKAFSAWAENHVKIAKHNAKGLNYTFGHNEFSDMTSEEFFANKLGFNSSFTNQDTFSKRPLHEHDPNVKIPDSIDWVSGGAVTKVKNQGNCGSCWSFSTTGALEGALKVSGGPLVSLSEQDLVSCNSNTDSGCNGGLMDNAFTWVESNGIASEQAYPYTSGGGRVAACDSSKESNPVMKITGFKDVKAHDPDSLMSAIVQQPVSVAIEADQDVFHLYSGGIIDSGCGSTLDHGVLAVGYVAGDGGYYKVKNSWGTTWGEDGYVRISNKKQGWFSNVGVCGILKQPSYPTGAQSTVVEA